MIFASPWLLKKLFSGIAPRRLGRHHEYCQVFPERGTKAMIFYTADLHLFHKKILEYEKRPFASIEDMHETIISRWNSKVGEDDEVYILGDLSFQDSKRTAAILRSLKGKKYLLRGNHDGVADSEKVQNELEWVKDYYTLEDSGYFVVLFHYPILAWDGSHRGSIHLHGHIHSTLANKGMDPQIYQQIRNIYNVGVDVCNYEPVSLHELVPLV